MNQEELTDKVQQIERRVENVETQLKYRVENVETQLKYLEKNIEARLDHIMPRLEKRICNIENHLSKGKVILLIDNVAKMLNLKPITIYKLARAGKIPCHRPTNGQLYFMLDELKVWIQSRLDTEDIKKLVEENEEYFQTALKEVNAEERDNNKATKS